MSAVFSEDSEPVRSNDFFNAHFGGSTFLQVAVEAESSPRATTASRSPSRPCSGRSATWPRGSGHRGRRRRRRTVVEPVMLLNEALGGRRGIPETAGRGGRVLTYLLGHPAVAQLMTSGCWGRADPRRARADERRCASARHRRGPGRARLPRRRAHARRQDQRPAGAGHPGRRGRRAAHAAARQAGRRCRAVRRRAQQPLAGAARRARGSRPARSTPRTARSRACRARRSTASTPRACSPPAAPRSRRCSARSCRPWPRGTPRASASRPSTSAAGPTRSLDRFRVEGRCASLGLPLTPATPGRTSRSSVQSTRPSSMTRSGGPSRATAAS